MKRLAFIFIVGCSPVLAQTAPPVPAISFAQSISNAVALDAAAGALAARNDTTRCQIIQRAMAAHYVQPRVGYAPTWLGPSYFGYNWNAAPLWDDQLHLANEQTTAWPQLAWNEPSANTLKIASSSSSSSSSASSSTWSDSTGKMRSETTTQTEVTVNGVKYRTFSHELKTTPEPTEPESLLDGTYYCR